MLADVINQPAEHQTELADGAHGHANFIHTINGQCCAVVAGGHIQRLLAQSLNRARKLQLQHGAACSKHGSQQTHQPPMDGAAALQSHHAHHAQQPQRHHVQPHPRADGHGLAGRQNFTNHAAANHDAFVDALAFGGTCTHGGIQRFCGLLFFGMGFGAHGHIAFGYAVADNGYSIGAYPVIVAVLAAVFDQSAPGLTGFERGPHIGKGFGRHVGVAHDVVRLVPQLFNCVATGFHKRGVGVADVAVGVCGGHQRGVVVHHIFMVAHWLVVAHAFLTTLALCD